MTTYKYDLIEESADRYRVEVHGTHIGTVVNQRPTRLYPWGIVPVGAEPSARVQVPPRLQFQQAAYAAQVLVGRYHGGFVLDGHNAWVQGGEYGYLRDCLKAPA